MNEEHIFQQFNEDNLAHSHDYSTFHDNQQNEDVVMDQQQEQQQLASESGDGNNPMVLHAYSVIESEESMLDPHVKPKAVHQCPVCNKIFVSFKGLQQHAIIHTDQKPFECDICRKSFRFKSNLFEHRSVHSGTTPHRCPLCGKTCRLKGNLKKHLRTHCNTKEELDVAWQPFASNRRAPAEIPQDAIIIRANADPTALFTPPSRPRKHRKLGLGSEARVWIEKIRRGEILPLASIEEKMKRLADLIKMVEENNLDMEGLYHHASAIPFERYECPICKSTLFSRAECSEHMEADHPTARKQRPHFCELCLRTFSDRQQLSTHQEHHKRVQLLLQSDELRNASEPQIMMPMLEHDAMRDGEEEVGERIGEEEENTEEMGMDGTEGTDWDQH